jgi:hypothetical protein
MVVFSFYGLRAKYIYIQAIYCNGGRQSRCAPRTLVLRRWNDGDHAMTHKMETECVKDHIISHYIYM